METTELTLEELRMEIAFHTEQVDYMTATLAMYKEKLAQLEEELTSRTASA